MPDRTTATGFRVDLRVSRRLLGAFVKTAATSTVEIAALAGLDFVVLDTEHAPFSPPDVDRAILAGRSAGMPVLVRVPHHEGPAIQQALDMGAAGVLVPHVSSAAIARAVVASARFADGARGYSNSPRAGAYGSSSMKEYVAAEDARVAIVAQIEDPAAVDVLDEIAAVEGIDALFAGPADLAVGYGASGPTDPVVVDVVDAIARAARKRGLACGTFATMASFDPSRDFDFVIVGSDQSVLREGWRNLIGTIR